MYDLCVCSFSQLLPADGIRIFGEYYTIIVRVIYLLERSVSLCVHFLYPIAAGGGRIFGKYYNFCMC